jgi:uncharacterized protein
MSSIEFPKKRMYLVVILFGIFLFVSKVAAPVLIEDTDIAPKISINGNSIAVEIVDTPQKRSKGLSGRESIGEDVEGLLFVFEDSDTYGIWMKDMNFSIDVLWFNSDRNLVYIEESMHPETYPDVFRPKEDSLYVLELDAGYVKDFDIKIGDKFDFSK